MRKEGMRRARHGYETKDHLGVICSAQGKICRACAVPALETPFYERGFGFRLLFDLMPDHAACSGMSVT
jgi:hypothetical protein